MVKTKVGRSSTKNYAKFYKKYLDGALQLQTYQKIAVLLLIFVFSGTIGWLWEFLLAEIMGGFRGLYIEGGNLLPWVNIYAYGAIVIMLVSWRLKRYPWAVFVASALATGLLEWFGGWVVYNVGNGTRYWDYRDVWWGAGNIDGFVCFASATAFGLGALALMYWLLPRCIFVATLIPKRKLLTFAISLFAIVMIDDITNLTLKNLGAPTAHDFYLSMGWKYRN